MNTYRGQGQGQGPQHFRGCSHARTMLEHISISIIHMTSNWNNMALHAVCVEDLTIPPSTAIRVNMT